MLDLFSVVRTRDNIISCFLECAQTIQSELPTKRRRFLGLDLEPITEDKLVSTVENHNVVIVTESADRSLLFRAVAKQ